MGRHEVSTGRPSLRMQSAELFGALQRAQDLRGTEAGQAAHRQAIASALGIMTGNRDGDMLGVMRSLTAANKTVNREAGNAFQEAALIVQLVAHRSPKTSDKK